MILVNTASDGAPAPLPAWFHDASVVDRHVRRAEQAAALAESTLAEPLDDIAFDDVTALVRELLAVPASFVVLLGGDEDAVKSQCDARGVNQGERVLRGRSFCHYVAVAGQALVIDDTLAHAPWRDVPIVAGLNVRAYIGMPLWQGDVVLGTLCAIDHVPRRWTPRDRRCMTQLATSLQREMDLRRDRRQARLLARARELQLMAARAAMRDPLAALSLCALQLQDRKSTR